MVSNLNMNENVQSNNIDREVLWTLILTHTLL